MKLTHSLPPTAEVKNEWSYTSTPPICLRAQGIFKHFLPELAESLD